ALAAEEEHVLRCLGAAVIMCNGTRYRRRCNARSSTPPDRSESYWRRRRSAVRSPDFCTSTRTMPAAKKLPRRMRITTQDQALRRYRDGTMREAQSPTDGDEPTSATGGFPMSRNT